MKYRMVGEIQDGWRNTEWLEEYWIVKEHRMVIGVLDG